jgi:hypothetical protein
MALGPYVADKGFEGEEDHQRRLETTGRSSSVRPNATDARGDASAPEALGDVHPLHRRDCLRKAAQLLHLAQRTTWPFNCV